MKTQNDNQGNSRGQPRKIRHLWRGLAMFVALSISLIVALGYVALTGITAPEWVRIRLESRLNAAIPVGRLHIGAIRLAPLNGALNPQISLLSVELRDGKDRLRAFLPRVTGRFSGAGLLGGRLRPVLVSIRDARVLLTRGADGQFDVSIGGQTGGAVLAEKGNIGSLIQSFEDVFKTPLLSALKQVQSLGTVVFLDDRMSGRKWTFRNGNLVIKNGAKTLSASVTFKLDTRNAGRASGLSDESGSKVARVTFGWSKEKGGKRSEFSTNFNGLKTEDIADQVAVFNWLRLLQAPIGGAMTLDVSADGGLGNMHGVLDLGAGRLRKSPQSQPFLFSGAKAYFSYDPGRQRFTFEQINVETEAASLRAEGQAYLSDRIDRTVGGLIGQLRLSKISLNPKGVFAHPVTLDSVVIDARLRIDPLVVDIGQMVLVDGTTRVVVKGQISSDKPGWTMALDLSANRLSTQRMIALWPLSYKEKTRAWMQKNVLAGVFEKIHGALRLRPGQKPVLSLGFDLRKTSVRFIKTFPPIVDGIGYGVLADNKLHITVQQGTVTAPNGSQINMAGSSFHILDTRIKHSPARVDLQTQSSLGGLLSLLDLRPFRFLSKSGVATDIARGTVQTDGTITFPLSDRVTFDQVRLSVNGELREVSSDRLIKGKRLSARRLTGFVDNAGLTISGTARVGKVPVSGLWQQKFGRKNKGKSRVEGQIEFSKAFADEFGINLPDGTIRGRGVAHLVVRLKRGKAPSFRLLSDLNRVALALPAVGWTKPKNEKGQMEIVGRLGKTPEITRLVLRTKGLRAEGAVKITPSGKLEVASFPSLDVGGWLKTPLEIRPGADGQAAFVLLGGTIDLRKSHFSSTPSVNRKGNRIDVRLDRLILSKGISLTSVEGALNTTGGVTGSFSGRVNGKTEIKGTIAPNKGGTAVRFTSSDAGAVMRDAGVFGAAIGGRLDMILTPAGKAGVYDGTLKAKKVRVKNATALADILSAISVVGLLEQLGGEGILFSDVNARFRLSPTAVSLQQSSAVGASMGLTMEGAYNLQSHRVDMQGVVTPIYLLNGVLERIRIFGKLFGKQKGEGLFGFTYTLKGDVDKPKVGVNPLSILTPGLFRDIFRRPIPTAADVATGKAKKKASAPPEPALGGDR